jgi:ribosomal protein S18 acetylase RimI-like enzyme
MLVSQGVARVVVPLTVGQNGAVSVTVVPMTASHPAAERVAAVFDEYRCHYGQLPAPVATRTWLLDQLGCQRMALTAALDEADQCLGFITTTAMPASLMLGTAWSIRDLYVAPDYRRGGIAGRLVRHAVDDARVAGALRVSLQTEPDNAPALALYTAVGFQPVSGLTLLTLALVPQRSA